MTTDWHAECVKKYNVLPRKRLAPSGLVPNVWHFDLRYIPISPPSHMLFLLQKESQFVAQQVLPVGNKNNKSGLLYFPETAKEAALEVCLGLMHSFNTVFDQDKTPGPMISPYAPWRFTTDDRALARAVENKFKALGVKEDRCKVDFVDITTEAHDRFDGLYKGIVRMLDLPDIARAAFETPTSIAFSTLPVADPEGWLMRLQGISNQTPKDVEFQKISDYAQEFMNNEPLPVNSDDNSKRFAHLGETLERIKAITMSSSLEEVRRKADAGDAQHAVDAALRLKYGIKCKSDRTLSREYLIKAALNEQATAQTRSIAHSMLIFWYTGGRKGPARARFVFAAAYHADEAVRLISDRFLVSGGAPTYMASANALLLAMNTIESLTQDMQVPELLVHFKWIVKASDERKAYIQLEQLAAEKKMMKKPNRYRCARLGCGIEADTGKMLSRCSGKCDPDKKPYYCSKRCREYLMFFFHPSPRMMNPTTFLFQNKKYAYLIDDTTYSLPNVLSHQDWKNHKPFCRPGAPCSVLSPSTTTVGGGSTSQGSIRVPVHHADGTTSLLSTSTMEPEMLKEMGAAMKAAKKAGLDGSSTLRMELNEVD
ncbi:hypothetical protein J3R30DRAFT_3710930 [Lentinula aciculospora]|uniref:MYND-type domain-containing protein n=1 Tax=Lentinula aciculospora TaxID=153920 RepID=A0A9W9A0N0_9AGAR|nr:hypothetical protein J3R30DRAFT_3710930 [Lentinula aciculospora]